MNLDQVIDLCRYCIEEGQKVLETKRTQIRESYLGPQKTISYVDLQKFHKWQTSCLVLYGLLGDLGKPWESTLGTTIQGNTHSRAVVVFGALESLLQMLENGYLVKIEKLIYAEAFSSLIEQAEYLFRESYYLPAGVIARAVLEEKLRELASDQNIEFTRSRPTLSTYNAELYRVSFYDLSAKQFIDYLIGIGNKAAHNQPFESEEIKKLIDGVKETLERY